MSRSVIVTVESSFLRPGDKIAKAGASPGETRSGAPQTALTVAQVVSQIRALIERQFPAPIWIEGELSNCSFPASGHIYFSLVDEKVTDKYGQRLVLPCAFFKHANQSLKFKLTDGLKVVCLGEVTTYDSRGQYQLRVIRVLPKGKGELQLAFEQLKKQLQTEGLFEEVRKRPIPAMPNRIGVITSRSGSAIHDMVSKLRGWFHVIVLPVKVQGDGASTEIAEALDLANRLRIADVLIVGRGGGSVEDLWAFNEEPVARAIARSHIPVISAIGHQDDWTIADYVADRRASTPTDAAKLLVYDQEALLNQSQELVQQLVDGMQRWLDEQEQQLDTLQGQLRLLHPLNQLDRYLTRTQELQVQMTNGMHYSLDREERNLQGLAGRLHALSPLAVLARGYSITMKLPAGAMPTGEAGRTDRHVVTDAGSLHMGDELETLLAKGVVRSTVTQLTKDTRDAHGTNA